MSGCRNSFPSRCVAKTYYPRNNKDVHGALNVLFKTLPLPPELVLSVFDFMDYQPRIKLQGLSSGKCPVCRAKHNFETAPISLPIKPYVAEEVVPNSLNTKPVSQPRYYPIIKANIRLCFQKPGRPEGKEFVVVMGFGAEEVPFYSFEQVGHWRVPAELEEMAFSVSVTEEAGQWLEKLKDGDRFLVMAERRPGTGGTVLRGFEVELYYEVL